MRRPVKVWYIWNLSTEATKTQRDARYRVTNYFPDFVNGGPDNRNGGVDNRPYSVTEFYKRFVRARGEK